MGYRIDYQPQKQKQAPRRMVLTGLFFILFLLGVGQLWPEGGRVLRGVFFSGDWTVTAGAFRTLISDLETDVPAMEAACGFCRQILEGNGYGVR